MRGKRKESSRKSIEEVNIFPLLLTSPSFLCLTILISKMTKKWDRILLFLSKTKKRLHIKQIEKLKMIKG